MGVFDKLKSIFYDEIVVEDTDSELEKVDKAVKEVEPVKPKIEKVDFSTFEEKIPEEKEPIKEENTFSERELFRSERTFNFTQFDEPEELPPRKNILEIEKNRNSRVNDVKPPVSEVKVFKPSPVISPIYGILNKDYKKEEIKEKKFEEKIQNNDISKSKVTTYDTVRRKAYGTLEDDLEDSLNNVNKISSTEINEKMYSENTTERYQTKKSKIEDLINKIEEVDEEIDKSMTIGDLEEKIVDNDFEEVSDKTMTDSHLEHDLFNLIDSMYDDREE